MTSLEHRGRARLLAYAPWILRDYLTNQGPSTAVVIILIGLLTVLPVGTMHLMAAQAATLMRSLVGILAFFGAFFATNGIVATDRRNGYYKFLFAKPVSPPAYYLFVFAVYGAGLLLVTLALLALWAAVVRPMFPVELFAVVSLMFVAYGGVGFLLSAAFRYDWLSLVTVVLGANIAWTVWGGSASPAHLLLYLLPPVHRVDDVYAIVGGGSTPWSAVAWLGGYGILCLGAGLLVVRKRSLASQ